MSSESPLVNRASTVHECVIATLFNWQTEKLWTVRRTNLLRINFTFKMPHLWPRLSAKFYISFFLVSSCKSSLFCTPCCVRILCALCHQSEKRLLDNMIKLTGLIYWGLIYKFNSTRNYRKTDYAANCKYSDPTNKSKLNANISFIQKLLQNYK